MPSKANLINHKVQQVVDHRFAPLRAIQTISRVNRTAKYKNDCKIVDFSYNNVNAHSSGIVERLNNKAKVTMRKACGFRTFKMLELALYHVLGKLPEPKLTHSFY